MSSGCGRCWRASVRTLSVFSRPLLSFFCSAGDDGEWVTEAQSPIWGSDLGSEQTQDGFKPEDMSQVTAAQRPVPPLAS